MQAQEMKLSEVRKLLSGRKIYVRCNDLRFKITRTVFEDSIKSIAHKNDKITIMTEYNEKYVLIESVNQNLHS